MTRKLKRFYYNGKEYKAYSVKDLHQKFFKNCATYGFMLKYTGRL